MPFKQSREFVHKLYLKNTLEWYEFRKSAKKPYDIPSHPERVYRGEWKGIGDWLGTDRIANQDRQYLTFEEAKKIVHGLKLKSQLEWREHSKAQKLATNIPSHPDRVYKKYWKGWGNWLGTGRIANQELKYRTFAEAKAFVHTLKLKSRNE